MVIVNFLIYITLIVICVKWLYEAYLRQKYVKKSYLKQPEAEMTYVSVENDDRYTIEKVDADSNMILVKCTLFNEAGTFNISKWYTYEEWIMRIKHKGLILEDLLC